MSAPKDWAERLHRRACGETISILFKNDIGQALDVLADAANVLETVAIELDNHSDADEDGANWAMRLLRDVDAVRDRIKDGGAR